jgi:hypothetical protein
MRGKFDNQADGETNDDMGGLPNQNEQSPAPVIPAPATPVPAQ